MRLLRKAGLTPNSSRRREGAVNRPFVLNNTTMQGFEGDAKPRRPLKKGEGFITECKESGVPASHLFPDQRQSVTLPPAIRPHTLDAFTGDRLPAVGAGKSHPHPAAGSHGPPRRGPLCPAAPRTKMVLPPRLAAMLLATDAALVHAHSAAVVVLALVLGIVGAQHEIFDPIIERVVVDVVDDLLLCERSADVFFHYHPVAKYIPLTVPNGRTAVKEAMVFRILLSRSGWLPAPALARIQGVHESIITDKEIESTYMRVKCG